MGFDLALDFDGVLHPGSISEVPIHPVPGIKEAIKFIRSSGKSLCIYTDRLLSDEGRSLTLRWLKAQEFPEDIPVFEYPPTGTACIVSANGFRFDGSASGLLSILSMGIPGPWYTDGSLVMVSSGVEAIAQAHHARRNGLERKKPDHSEHLLQIFNLATYGAEVAEQIDKVMTAFQQKLE